MRSLVSDNDAREGSVPVGDNSRRWRGGGQGKYQYYSFTHSPAILTSCLQCRARSSPDPCPGWECDEPETSQYNNTRLSSVPGPTSPFPDLNPAPQLDTDNVRTWRYDHAEVLLML